MMCLFSIGALAVVMLALCVLIYVAMRSLRSPDSFDESGPGAVIIGSFFMLFICVISFSVLIFACIDNVL